MTEEEKEAIRYFVFGLINIIFGMYLWNKFPTDARHLFFTYWGGKLIGMGWMKTNIEELKGDMEGDNEKDE